MSFNLNLKHICVYGARLLQQYPITPLSHQEEYPRGRSTQNEGIK